MTPFLFFLFFLSIHAASDHHTTVAATHAQSPSSDCMLFTSVNCIRDCATFVMMGESDAKPKGMCCFGVAIVSHLDANCLYVVFRELFIHLELTLNITKVSSLPAACEVDVSMPNCEVESKYTSYWLYNQHKFKAGETAIVVIRVPENKTNILFQPTLSVNGKTGNISYIIGVSMKFNFHNSTGTISFIPIKTGFFNIFIEDKNYNVSDYSLNFEARADAFGNNVFFSDTNMEQEGFSLSLSNQNGTIDSYINLVPYVRWFAPGYVSIEFALVTSGKFLLRAEKEGQKLNGGTLLPLEFDTHVVKEIGLSIPISDFKFKYVEPGVQLLSFTLNEQGNFTLTLSDMKNNKSISGMPYAYTVYAGYCDGTRNNDKEEENEGEEENGTEEEEEENEREKESGAEEEEENGR
ncbi:unnamed protein product [Cochlearia groenlandica]